MSFKILILGEIVGKPGIFCIKNGLNKLKEEHNIDFVIANGEGTTGGFGIGKNHSIQIHKLGIDVITTGEKVFFKKDMVSHIGNSSYILRPANYPPGTPGRGWRVYKAGTKNVAVVSLLGQSGFHRIHLSNPFTFIPDIINRVKDEADIIILDFHASTTAEKYSMFFHVDGSLNAVLGSHSKAISSDASVFPKGTAVICDTGRTGSSTGVGGLAPDIEIQQFLSQIPERSKEWWNDLELQGAIVEIDDDNKTKSIKEIRYPVTEAPNDGTR